MAAASISNDPDFNPVVINGLPVSFETVLGDRYFVSDNLGIFGEIGIGHGFITGGIVTSY